MTNDDRNREFERIFVGNNQRTVSHFYSVVSDKSLAVGPLDREPFAYGYWTQDEDNGGTFHHGLTYWDAVTGTFERELRATL